ncbi:TonB-dependent receptor [Sanyastnella coralliicola]|uniref:TonB-dependent receptor n=1 Tax=Sanyastnella coralliicola TaxID=3069118 RepID=UPI0027B9E5F8|nr:carboxypeptidase regulatory-like domain-containing protein [Longitalea sp. SCSIO 12813]
MKSTLSLLIFSLLFFASAEAQLATQRVSGSLKDLDTQLPIVGANIFVPNSDPFIGTNSDLDGNFSFEAPIGRIDLKISAIGYEDVVMPNMLVTAGREVLLNLEMTESVIQMEAAEITAKESPTEVSNDMATVSSRTFSVEETSRYAGSFNDPARMVAGFAGVTSDPEGNNDIVVRGNSPKGIQWRLEGIEIPNPNHFSDEGSTGGPINALNSDLLANSDFYSGAFAPEFGNAFSGLFDIKLRNGNPNQRQYSVGIGVLGTDVTMEGPLNVGNNASYLFNYRYSSLAMLDAAGIVDFQGVPKYQDAAFKVNVPTKNAGVFTTFGLMGRSKINEQLYLDEEETVLETDNDYNSGLTVIGATHTIPLGEKSYLKSSMTFSENHSGFISDERDSLGTFYLDDDGEIRKSTVRGATTYNHKFNARNKLRTGVIYSQHFYSLNLSYIDEDIWERVTTLDRSGEAGVFQGFASWQYRMTQDVSFTGGVHVLSYLPNSTYYIEPRLGMKWKVNELNTITAGFGVHSKTESITNYQAIDVDDFGNEFQPNTELELPKARHYVLGYERQIAPLLFARAEVYYQDLYDIPVENDPTSSYSLINSNEWFTTRDLVNSGTGENYGVEFTLERFFDKGMFFMVTGSLYESKYVALDGVKRNSRYNGNYATNAIIGKEFPVGDPAKKRVLAFNGRFSLIGGRRTTPIDLEASRLEGESVYSDDVYSKKLDDIFIGNIAISLRRDRPNSTHELKMDVQNFTNNQARLREYYDEETGGLAYDYQLSLLPVLSYRITF